MDSELEYVFNGLYVCARNIVLTTYRIGGSDVVGVFIVDKTGEIVACMALSVYFSCRSLRVSSEGGWKRCVSYADIASRKVIQGRRMFWSFPNRSTVCPIHCPTSFNA